jgi:hypothetical protein
MSEFERRVGSAILGRQKAANAEGALSRLLAARWGHLDDPEINAVLADGAEAYHRRVCSRVLADSAGEVFVNHYPECSRVLRAPRARQCFWCGHDWHDQVP